MRAKRFHRKGAIMEPRGEAARAGQLVQAGKLRALHAGFPVASGGDVGPVPSFWGARTSGAPNGLR